MPVQLIQLRLYNMRAKLTQYLNNYKSMINPIILSRTHCTFDYCRLTTLIELAVVTFAIGFA